MPRVSGSGAPASMDVPCEGGWKKQRQEFEGLPVVGRSWAPQVVPGEEDRKRLRAPTPKLRAECPAVIDKGSGHHPVKYERLQPGLCIISPGRMIYTQAARGFQALLESRGMVSHLFTFSLTLLKTIF